MTSHYTNYLTENSSLKPEDHKQLRSKISKLVLSQSLFSPIFITAITLTTRKEKDYVSVKVRHGNKDFKLGRLYKFVFFPNKHMEYYKQCAKKLKLKINDYLDKVISGEYDLCDNSDPKYLLTDVQLLETYPFLEIIRDGISYTYDELDELKIIEANDIKNGEIPNNILPKYFNQATKLVDLIPLARSTNEHVGYVRDFKHDLFNLDDLVTFNSNNNSSSNSSNDSDSSSDSSNDSDSINNFIKYDSNNIESDNEINTLVDQIINLNELSTSEVIKDEYKTDLDDILNAEDDFNIYSESNTDHSLSIDYNSDCNRSTKTYRFKTDINAVISGKRGPKTTNKVVKSPEDISCSKNYLSACMVRECFEEEHLITDISQSLLAIGIKEEKISKIIDMIVAIGTINIVSTKFSYSSLTIGQKAHALGFSTVINPSSVPALLRLLSDTRIINQINYLRMSRIGSKDSVVVDATKIKHESKNNTKAVKTVHSVDKKYIQAISTTIGISEFRNSPVYLDINGGNRTDFNILKDNIKLFEINDIKGVSQVIVDRGYASRENFYKSAQANIDMIGALKSNDSISRNLIDEHFYDIAKYLNKYALKSNKEVYGKTVPITLNIDEDKKLDCYAHVFLNPTTKTAKVTALQNVIDDTISYIGSINSYKVFKNKYDKDKSLQRVIKQFFSNYSSLEDIFSNRRNIEPDYEALADVTEKLGFFVTISTKELTASDTYKLYKHRANIEVLNKHLKNSCSLKTQRSQTTDTCIGSQVLTFITAIASYALENHMKGNVRDHEGNLLIQPSQAVIKKYKTRYHLFSQLDDHKIFIDYRNKTIEEVSLDKHLNQYLTNIGFPNFDKTAEKYLKRIKENEAIVTAKLANM